MNLDQKRVLIFQQRDWAIGPGQYLAKKLRDEGCILAAITLKGTVDAMIRRQTDVVYEDIFDHDAIWDDPYIVKGLRDISLADVCESLGVDSIWPLASAERHYVRTYTGKLSYSFRQNRSDEDIIAYVKACYLEVLRLLDEFKPDIIVGLNYASTLHLILQLLASKRDITNLALSHSRIQDLHVIVHDFNFREGPMAERVTELHEGNVESANKDRAREYIEAFRSEFQRPHEEAWGGDRAPLGQRVKNHLRPFKRALMFYRKRPPNETPKLGLTLDFETPRMMVRSHFAHELNRRRALRLNYTSLSDTPRFIYFPLQSQPEQQVDVLAPYFNNQIETSRLVAQSLPDDLTLVVKEHPLMIGRRKVSYYEKLEQTPNVKLVHPMTPSESIMQKTTGVVSTGGTTIVEAAMYRLPVVQLGNLGLTLLLPNVKKVTDLPCLASALKKLFAVDMSTPEYDRCLENYVAAAYDVGIPMNYSGVKFAREESVMEPLWLGYRSEIERVLSTPARTPAPS